MLKCEQLKGSPCGVLPCTGKCLHVRFLSASPCTLACSSALACWLSVHLHCECVLGFGGGGRRAIGLQEGLEGQEEAQALACGDMDAAAFGGGCGMVATR